MCRQPSPKSAPETPPPALRIRQRIREPVVGEDLLHDGQAQPPPVAFGGEEGGEELGAGGFGDSRAAVFDAQDAVGERRADGAFAAGASMALRKRLRTTCSSWLTSTS